MSTNSCVAIPSDGEWKGRWVHWDGYPAGVGLAVYRIVNRDGLARATQVLVHENTYWSTLTGEQGSPRDAEMMARGGFEFVEGYGETSASRGEDMARFGNGWIGPSKVGGSGDLGSIEWVYILLPDGLAIRPGHSPDGILVPWGMEPGDEDHAALESVQRQLRVEVSF